jgi:SAM-dependent methyltransferase
MWSKTMATESIKDIVKQKYGATAQAGLSSNQSGVRAVAEAFGYSAEELASIPAEANMGLSCGNPIALAHIREGETVVDLGSGGGLDVFLAAAKVGPRGKAIGIDMTPEMLELANANARKGDVNGRPYTNVEFHLSSIEKIPLPEASADVIISNCVINLATDKHAVFREMFRVLKPGGRVAVSDIALRKALPAELEHDLAAYVGCVAGAIEIATYKEGLITAGFSQVAVIDAHADLNAYAEIDGQSGCCSPAMSAAPAQTVTCCSGAKTVSLSVGSGCCSSGATTVHDGLTQTLNKYDINEYAASVKIFAVKP